MRMFFQLTLATLKDMIRDRMVLFWFIAFPLLFTLLFGSIFSGGGYSNMKFDVGLVTTGEGPMSQGIEEAFGSVPVFNLHRGTEEDEIQAIKDGGRSLVVVVPEIDMASVMAKGEPTGVQIHYNPSQQTTARMLINSVKEILSEVERHATGSPKILEVEEVKVQVEELKDIDYLIPGILAMALMQLGLFGTFGYVELREKKVIKRLGATPLKRSMMLWSEILIRMFIAVFQCLAIVVVAQTLFDVKIVGNWFVIIALVIFGAATFISLGYFLVSFTRSAESSQGLVQMVQFPMMFLSGIFFPLAVMPSFLKPIIRALPLTYLGDVLRHVMVGLPMEFSWSMNLGILGGWLVITLVLAIVRFRWE